MVFYCLGGIAFLPWGDLYDLRTTWFVISPHLAAVNQAQSTKQQVKGPRSLFLLGPRYCSKKGPSHFGDSAGDWEKGKGRSSSFTSMAPKLGKHQEEGKFLLVPSISRSRKCGFLQRTSHWGALYGILGNFPTQDKFYASLFFPFYILQWIIALLFTKGG